MYHFWLTGDWASALIICGGAGPGVELSRAVLDILYWRSSSGRYRCLYGKSLQGEASTIRIQPKMHFQLL